MAKRAFKHLFSAEKVPMTALDENVNRVPRVYPTNEPMGECSLLFNIVYRTLFYRLLIVADDCGV